MNLFESIVDSVIGQREDRTPVIERADDFKYLCIEMQCVIERMLELEPDNMAVQYLRMFLVPNMRRLEALEGATK